MRLTRIHAHGPLKVGVEVKLPSAGAYHVAKVLRMREGAPLLVFDGSGGEYRAEIVKLQDDSVVVRLGEFASGTSESPLKITLVQGVSRSERMDWTLQKATELGVAAIAPVLSARSVVRLDEKQAAKKQEHWRGIVISACEQCGRTRIPDITVPVTLRQYLSTSRHNGMRLILSPS